MNYTVDSGTKHVWSFQSMGTAFFHCQGMSLTQPKKLFILRNPEGKAIRSWGPPAARKAYAQERQAQYLKAMALYYETMWLFEDMK